MNVKEHIRKHKTTYACLATSIIVAGITTTIMRRNSKPNISRDTIVAANHDTIVIGQNSVLNNVSFISSNRQGAPSWVVRCLETNEIFTSQRSAAEAMGLSSSRLSQHLTGVTDHVDGYHFERICMAA